jgi:hypothetical protein
VAAQRRHDRRDTRTSDVLQEPSPEQAAGDHGPGVAGADDGLDLALG